MEPTIVPFVRSSCHRGCERKGTDIKRTGRCPALSFATVVKNSKWDLEHDNFISFITLATPLSEKQNEFPFSYGVYMLWFNFVLALNFVFVCFSGMVMYGTDFETKENKI